jgi:hypothetical protein
MAAGIANARLVVVPDSGHLSTLERPDAVTKALVDWMDGRNPEPVIRNEQAIGFTDP